MSRSESKGPKLPRGLLDQIGGNEQNQGRQSRTKYQSQRARKEHRKAERDERKQSRSQARPLSRAKSIGKENDDSSSAQEEASGRVSTRSTATRTLKRASRLNTPGAGKLSELESDNDRSLLHDSKPSISRAVKERLAEDDADIAELEKRLGIKGKTKTPKALQDDGLDFLLEDLPESDNDRKRQREEYEHYIRTKRQRVDGKASELSLNLRSGADDQFSKSDDSDGTHDELLDDGEVFGGVQDDDLSPAPSVSQPRENPYVAPVDSKQVSIAKYVPPSMRQMSDADEEVRSRLRKQVQGLLNRLSEANVVSIVREVEGLYQNNPRQYVTSTLTDLLIASLANRTRLNDTFIVLHAGFVAALYKTIGLEFGAQFLERVVADFDNAYNSEVVHQDSKVSANLVSLIAVLYIFQVITANLVLDYVRLFLRSVSETNTELLLLVVRSCGTQLRQDDPSSLKDVVTILHSAVAEVGESRLSVRTKFMIETVNNLKNNRAKAGATASAVVGEHITRMKKAIGSLTARRATEPFGLSLANIRDAEKTGKWWLVGASWKGDDKRRDVTRTSSDAEDSMPGVIGGGTGAPDGEDALLDLAKNMGMNTEVRRAVFISIMSASDVKDAQLRLLKLHLKKAQELEIPRVLIKCAGAEQTYNHYYGLIAQRLCNQDRRLQKAFQFSLWDFFRRLGEKHDEDEDVDEDEDEEQQSIPMRQIVNLGKMFGMLMVKGVMPISALKVLSFGILRSKTMAFLEVLFVTILRDVLQQTKPERRQSALIKVVDGARLAPEMVPGLQLFLGQLAKSDMLRDGQDGKEMRRCCRFVTGELRRFEGEGAKEGFS